MSEYCYYFANGESFFMAAETFPDAIAAVRQDVQEETDDWAWPYELKDLLPKLPDDAEPRHALERILDACRWQAPFDASGNTCNFALTKEASRAGGLNTEQTGSLFWTLAPFVRHGSRVYLTDNHANARVYHFRDGKCRVEYFRAYTQPDRALVSDALLERLRAYLIASDVAGGGPAAELLAELQRLLD